MTADGGFDAREIFLSTPSARRATSSHSPRNTEPSDFYPRPPRGGRPKPVDYKKEDIPISIHALREEGDRKFQQRRHKRRNISIHALREEGDEVVSRCGIKSIVISIHALREEGDRVRVAGEFPRQEFLSTPSARRATPRW